MYIASQELHLTTEMLKTNVNGLSLYLFKVYRGWTEFGSGTLFRSPILITGLVMANGRIAHCQKTLNNKIFEYMNNS